MGRKVGIAVFALLLVLAPEAQAMVGSTTLEDLVRLSDVIVVANVQRVAASQDGMRVATARVVEVWKGKVTELVTFTASPSWTCDITEANDGETAVLFLGKAQDGARRKVLHAGRGRMPIRTVDGRTFATIWAEDVRLPTGTQTTMGPEKGYDFIQSVELKVLRSLVQRSLRAKGPARAFRYPPSRLGSLFR